MLDGYDVVPGHIFYEYPRLGMTTSSDWTVSIPTCNRYHLLGDALLSLFSQRIHPAKIIITDNSTESLPDKLKRTFQNHHIVYHRHKPPISAWNNFKYGLNMCDTSFFSWLQDDDVLLSNFSSAALPVLEDESIGAVIGYAYYSSDVDRVYSLRSQIWGPPPFRMDFVNECPFIVPRYALIPWLSCYWPGFSPVAIFRSCLIRKVFDAIQEPTGYSFYLSEKKIIAAINSLAKIAYLPVACGVIRQHSNNATHGHRQYNEREVAAAKNSLNLYMYSMIQENPAGVEIFFSENIGNFSLDEVRYIVGQLRLFKSPLTDMVLVWIAKYAHYKDSAQSNRSTFVQTAASALKYITPPVVIAFFLLLIRCLKSLFPFHSGDA